MYAKEMAYGVTGIPALFYRLNFSNHREHALNVASEEDLEIVLKYIDDPRTRISIYRKLKDRIFRGKHYNSKLLNEVVSLVDFAHTMLRYGKLYRKERREAKRL